MCYRQFVQRRGFAAPQSWELGGSSPIFERQWFLIPRESIVEFQPTLKKFAKLAKIPAPGPNRGWEVGGGRTTRQPGQVRKEAALTRPGGSLSSLPLSAVALDRTMGQAWSYAGGAAGPRGIGAAQQASRLEAPVAGSRMQHPQMPMTKPVPGLGLGAMRGCADKDRDQTKPPIASSPANTAPRASRI